MRFVATTAAVLLGVPMMAASSPIASPTFAQHHKINASSHAAATSHVASKVTLASAETKAPTQPQIITVMPGDYLVKLANANNTTAIRLFYANTDIKNPDLIYPDQKLRVPTADETLTPRDVPANTQIVAQPAAAAAPAPTPAPQPVAQPETAPAASVSYQPAAPVAAPSDGSPWARLAACESGGNWAINTGNGFYGGLQFTLSSWRAVGGSGLPSDASRSEQIARAQMLQARQGWGAWPVCSIKAGLR